MGIDEFDIQRDIWKDMISDKDGMTVFQRSLRALAALDAPASEIEAAKKNFMFMPIGTNRATVRKYSFSLI